MMCPYPIKLKDREVPCGTCGFCVKTKAADWSFRLEQEWKVSYSAHVVLLTYNDENLPQGEDRFGNQVGLLWKPDLQNYFRRLKKHHAKRSHAKKYDVRYFAVGEYGGKFKRPHYHAIIFNCIDEDIMAAWEKHDIPMGYVSMKPLRTGGLGYLTTYFTVNNDYAIMRDIPQQFCIMSKRPGLGSNYLDTHTEWHLKGLKNYGRNKGHYAHLPRYYKNKIFNKQQLNEIAEKAQEYREEMPKMAASQIKEKNDQILRRIKNQKQ